MAANENGPLPGAESSNIAKSEVTELKALVATLLMQVAHLTAEGERLKTALRMTTIARPHGTFYFSALILDTDQRLDELEDRFKTPGSGR